MATGAQQDMVKGVESSRRVALHLANLASRQLAPPANGLARPRRLAMDSSPGHGLVTWPWTRHTPQASGAHQAYTPQSAGPCRANGSHISKQRWPMHLQQLRSRPHLE